MVDYFTVSESAKILGLSPKRIRQLIEEGKLTKRADNPVRITQKQVLTLKSEREKSGQYVRGVSAKPANTPDLTAQLEKILTEINENNRRAITALEQASEMRDTAYLEQIASLKAELERLRNAPKINKWWRSQG
jgi:DNA-binding transcriptional MerR regulator